jgi:hypothetical protein
MSDTHHIGREAQAAKMLLDAVNEKFDADEDAAMTVVEGETSLVEVIDQILVRIATLEAYQDGVQDTIGKMKGRADRLDMQAARLKASLMMALDTIGAKKMERPTATLSLAKSPDKAVITNEADLPSSFLIEKTTVSPDRKAILAALKEGTAIPGAELSNGGVSLRILTR